MQHPVLPALNVEVLAWDPDVQADVAASMAPLELDASEWSGCDLTDVQVRAGDGGAMNTLAYCSHKRGRNWVAVLRGKNAASMERDFLRLSGRQVDYQAIEVGEAFECGGDYYTSGGNPDRTRYYGVALETGDDRFVFAFVATAAQALRIARTWRANIEKMQAVAA